jgi:hypothetical protein
MSYGMTAELLKDVLPIGGTADASTVRRHLHKVAGRHDADLSDEQPGGIDEGPVSGQPLPQAVVIVGIDGGYVRNWYDKKRNFEIVVDKSMAADCDDRCFGFVRSQDEQPERRFRNVLRSQGLPVSQTVTMLTDGGDSVRALAGELSPGAVTMLDWFHICGSASKLRPWPYYTYRIDSSSKSASRGGLLSAPMEGRPEISISSKSQQFEAPRVVAQAWTPIHNWRPVAPDFIFMPILRRVSVANELAVMIVTAGQPIGCFQVFVPVVSHSRTNAQQHQQKYYIKYFGFHDAFSV